MKNLLRIFICLLFVVSITACTNNEDNDAEVGSNVPGLGDTITFDELEITFGTEVTWDVIDDQIDDELHDRDVFIIPVTVKNISDKTHGLSWLSYTQYGPNGKELDNTASIYFDDTIDTAGNTLSGADVTGDMIFLYEGNGTYTIEFSNMSETVKVEIDITK